MILICNRCMLAYYRHGRGGERRFLKSFRIPPLKILLFENESENDTLPKVEVSTTFRAN